MIRPGLSVLLERRLPELRSLRLGLVAHQASVTPNLHLAVEALREAGCRLVRLFSLEHGLWSAAPDGILVSSDWDSHLERPVVSLYRERRKTEEESPEGFFND